MLAELAGNLRCSTLIVCRYGSSCSDSCASFPPAPSVYFPVSYSHIQAIGNSFHVGKGIKAQVLSSFLFQNGKMEKYLQITSVAVKTLEGMPFSGHKSHLAKSSSVVVSFFFFFYFFLDLSWHLASLMTFLFLFFFSWKPFPHRSNLCSF